MKPLERTKTWVAARRANARPSREDCKLRRRRVPDPGGLVLRKEKATTARRILRYPTMFQILKGLSVKRQIVNIAKPLKIRLLRLAGGTEGEHPGKQKMQASPTMLLKTHGEKMSPWGCPTMLVKTRDLFGSSHDVHENKGRYRLSASATGVVTSIPVFLRHLEASARRYRSLRIAAPGDAPSEGTNASPENPVVKPDPHSTPSILIERTVDSSLRQLWRLTQALAQLRQGALSQNDIKNEDRPEEVVENKRPRDTMPEKKRDFVSENSEIPPNFARSSPILRDFSRHCVEPASKHYGNARFCPSSW